MEDRLLPATYTVISPLDSMAADPGTLRWAIGQANLGPGNTINFNIPGTGVQTISPVSALPAVTQPTTIDGTSQAGYANAPLIQISGVNAGATADGLVIAGGGTTVQGLAINKFGGKGIRLTGLGGDVIRANYIGTDPSGTQALANGGDGIFVADGSNSDTIGGLNPNDFNLISGNAGAGINVNATATVTGTLIEGNLIGTDIGGARPLGNGGFGVNVNNAPGTVVGGTAAGARNIISGNVGGGVQLGAGDGTKVQGNYIGTDITGTRAVGNSAAGINITNGSNDTVGGTAVGAGNVISGNGGSGIDSFSIGAGNDTIQGNYIGTDITGTLAIGNRAHGIHIFGLTDVVIGGTTASARNIISGNAQDGINTFGTSDGLLVEGNYIGVDAGGAKGLGNGGNGVNLFSNKNTIGGPAAGDGNIIAFNGTGTTGAGVNMILNSNGNAVLSNSIHDNAGLGINLGGLANNNQSFPVLNAATVNAAGTVVQGTFNSRPLGTYTLQFFASPAADGSGFGEGQTYLGSLIVQTDSNGNAIFTASLPVAAAAGSAISATATDSANNTSQFAQDVTTIGTADLGVAISAGAGSAAVGGQLTYTITVTNAGPSLARNVTAIDNLPAGVTVISAVASQGSVTIGASVINAFLDNLAVGDSATVTIVVQLGPGVGPSILDSVSVSTIDGDPNPNNNSASASTPVSAVADLAVSFNATAPAVLAGSNLSYTIVVTNHGPSPATGVTLTDTLPTGVTLVSAADDRGNTGTLSGSTVTDAIGPLASGSSVTVTIVISTSASTPPSIINTASVTSDEAGGDSTNDTASVTTAVTPVADLSVAINPSAPTVPVGTNLTYSVVVTNNGPSPATGVTLTDTLPAGVTLVSATDSLGNTLSPTGGVLADNLGGLAAGSSVTLTIVVTAGTTPATVQDSAQVTADQADTHPDDNTTSATTTVTPVADLAVTLTPPAAPALLNQPATYVFTVVNNGPSSATGVTLTIPLPTGVPFTFNSAIDSLGHTLIPSGGVIVDVIGNLDANLPQTLTLVVTPNGVGTLIEGSDSNPVRVTANEADPNTPNNSLPPASTSISPVANLSVSLVADRAQLVRGSPLTYTATVTNHGPSPATGVTLFDSLPASVALVAAPGATQGPGGTIVESLGTLASGASATVTIVVVPIAPGTVSNPVTASANEIDPTGADNTASVTTSVLDLPGTLEFAAPSYSVAEDGGTASIVVTRVGGSQGAVTVGFAVGGGTATSGIDYTPPTTTTLSFADGETSRTITIPVLADPLDGHDETLYLTLSNPTGGALLGARTSTTLTIQNVDLNHAPPMVQEVRLFGPSNAITDVALVFDEPMIPAAASNPNNYRIIPAGANGFAAAGTPSIGVSQAIYDPNNRTVSLIPSAALAANQFYLVRVVGAGVVDLVGNGLAGDGTGTPGTDFASYVGRGTKLSYVDQSGHLVSLSLTGGGVLDLTRSPSGQAQTLQVVAPVAGRSVLSGSVRGGSTTIGAITGLGQFGQVRVRMNTPPFLVSLFPFRLTPISPPAVDGVEGAPVTTSSKRKVAIPRPKVRAATPSGLQARLLAASRLKHR
jgi:uncharacterized repeat protein (TIGR01451 family)